VSAVSRTHLDRLYRLRRQVDAEIAAVERALGLTRKGQPIGPARLRRQSIAGRARATSLDYDPVAIRAWANANGIPCPTKGRFLPAWLVAAYREAHDDTQEAAS
jgi:hypothetical protein